MECAAHDIELQIEQPPGPPPPTPTEQLLRASKDGAVGLRRFSFRCATQASFCQKSCSSFSVFRLSIHDTKPPTPFPVAAAFPPHNASGAVHSSARVGSQVDAVQAALADGADPNARDDDGWTPLLWAGNNGERRPTRKAL